MPGFSVSRAALSRPVDVEGVAREQAQGSRPVGRDPFDWASLVVLIGVAMAALVTLRDYGLTNDEEVQHRYGELIVSYYTSGFADRSLFTYFNLYLYGGLFDILAALLSKLLPSADVYLLRHALSATFGLAGIAATWAVARLVAGPRAALIAAVMLAVTAQWYGPMFNHTKDIPFAAAMMGATYFLLRAARDLPAPRWGHLIGFGVTAGAACGVRAMGLLLFGYAGLIVLLYLARQWPRGSPVVVSAAGRAALRFAPAFALAYVIMLAAWPWAALAPLNPLRAIFAFSHFNYEIRTLLAGEIYTMATVPRWYVPVYLAIRLPLVMWAGAFVSALWVVGAAFRYRDAQRQRVCREIGWLLFFVLFPLTCEVVARGPAFTGLRHFLFVVPLLAALSGIGFTFLLSALSSFRPRVAAAAALALAAALAWQASMLVRLHPYQYLYYNALVGGLPGAAGRYVMDYWVNIMPEAVHALERYIERIDPGGRVYLVGVCGERFSFEHEAGSRLRWSKGWYEADFFIAPTHMGCHRDNNGNVVVSIERLGVKIGVVKDRRNFPWPADPPSSR